MLSLLIASFLISFFLIVNLWHRRFNKAIFYALTKATLMTIILSLGQFIPMLVIIKSIKINPPAQINLSQAALTTNNFITEALNNNIAAITSLGLILFILLILNLANYRRFNQPFQHDLIIGSLLFSLLTTNLFPWDLCQKFLSNLQFPWRFMVVIALLVSFSGGILCQLLVTKYHYHLGKFVILSLICIVTLHYATLLKHQTLYQDQKIIQTNQTCFAKIHSTYFNGIHDYKPIAAQWNDSLTLRQNKVKFANNDWRKVPTKITSSMITYNLDNQTDNIKNVILPVYYYPGQEITRNGHKIQGHKAYNGATKVTIKPGRNEFKVTYHYTKTMRYAQLFSLFGLVLFLINWLLQIKKPHSQT